MDNKNINLMPDNLRSKEKDVVSKTKIDKFQPNLVIPKKEGDKSIELKSNTNLGSDIKDLSLNKIEEKKAVIKKEKKKFSFSELFKKKDKVKKVEKKAEDDFKIPKAMPEKEVKQEKPELKLNLPKKEEFNTPKDKKKKDKVKKDDFSLNNEDDGIKFHEPKRTSRARLIGGDSGVDLIPDAARVRNWSQTIRLLTFSLLGSIFVILIFYFGLLFFERNLDIKQLITSQEIAEIQEEILSFDNLNKEIQELGKQISSVHILLNKHIYWTNFFELLEKYTLEDINYSGFSAGSGDTLILNATGPSFDSVSKQLQVLEGSENFVTDVKISSASLSETGVSFSITLILDHNLFYYQES